MEKVLLKPVVVVFFFILLSSEAYAISLGSIVKNDFAEIIDSESAKFKILFWNIETESYTLKLSIKESPEDWIVIIDPDDFVLDRTIGEEYISLPYMNENIRAKVVNLFVKPDSDSKPGNYSVVIEAGSRTYDESGGIKIVPERVLKFRIDLKGLVVSNDIENGLTPENESVSRINELKTIYTTQNQIDKEYLYLIVMFLIILASIIIYKKY